MAQDDLKIEINKIYCGDSSMAEQDLFQNQDSGSIPTSPLQFHVKNIVPKDANRFCSKWHYSKTCPYSKYLFGAFYANELVGVIAYGEPAMRNQKKCYNAILELRRLCMVDKSPKNSESRFISITLKMLKNMGIAGNIISLADPRFGHIGIVYRASNFKYMGLERGGGSRMIIISGQEYHSRTAFQKFGASGFKKLSNIFKDVQVVEKQRKHVYLYELLPPMPQNL